MAHFEDAVKLKERIAPAAIFRGEIGGTRPGGNMRQLQRTLPAHLIVAACILLQILFAETVTAAHFEQRNGVAHRRGKYNTEFYQRHNETYRNGAAIHFAHAIQHDLLQLTPLARAAQVDAETDAHYLDFMLNHKACTEPTMEYYGPYTARFAWTLYRAIDWTHMHHEQTYDVMSDRDIPWDEKKEWTDATVRYYLEQEFRGAQPGAARCHDAPRGHDDEALLRRVPEQVSPLDQLLLRRALVASGDL